MLEYMRPGQGDPQQSVQYKPYNDWEDLPPLVQDNSPRHSAHPQPPPPSHHHPEPPPRAPYDHPYQAPVSHRNKSAGQHENTVFAEPPPPQRHSSQRRSYSNMPPGEDMYTNTPVAETSYTNMPPPVGHNNVSPRGSSYANVPQMSPESNTSAKGPVPAPRPHLRSSTPSFSYSWEEGDPQSRAFYLLQRAADESSRSLNVSMVSNMSFDVEMMGADDSHFPPMSDNKTSVTLTENGEEILRVRCRNIKCGKTEELEEARKSYKTCHNCYTYYCSRECRKAHWEKHKKRCLFSKINSICKYVLKRVHDDEILSGEFSTIARAGYQEVGPGCVLLVFSSHVKAEEFLSRGMQCSEALPVYCSIDDLHEYANTFGTHQHELLDMCREYNPDIKYVLEVVVIANVESGDVQSRTPRKDGLSVKKCQKLRLTAAAAETAPYEEPETLILTAMPNAKSADPKKSKRAREILFSNNRSNIRKI